MKLNRFVIRIFLFPGEESAGERSLVMVMGGTYLLLAMLILLVVSLIIIK